MRGVPSKNEDLAFGLASEATNRRKLEAFFGCGLNKTAQFDAMDWSNDPKSLFVEMKTRRIRHNQYPTALIGKNKVDFCKKSNADCYFVYVYQDGIYYIKYDEALFATFECAEYERGWREGGIQPKQLFYFIPYQHLSPLPS